MTSEPGANQSQNQNQNKQEKENKKENEKKNENERENEKEKENWQKMRRRIVKTCMVLSFLTWMAGYIYTVSIYFPIDRQDVSNPINGFDPISNNLTFDADFGNAALPFFDPTINKTWLNLVELHDYIMDKFYVGNADFFDQRICGCTLPTYHVIRGSGTFVKSEVKNSGQSSSWGNISTFAMVDLFMFLFFSMIIFIIIIARSTIENEKQRVFHEWSWILSSMIVFGSIQTLTTFTWQLDSHLELCAPHKCTFEPNFKFYNIHAPTVYWNDLAHNQMFLLMSNNLVELDSWKLYAQHSGKTLNVDDRSNQDENSVVYVTLKANLVVQEKVEEWKFGLTTWILRQLLITSGVNVVLFLFCASLYYKKIWLCCPGCLIQYFCPNVLTCNSNNPISNPISNLNSNLNSNVILIVNDNNEEVKSQYVELNNQEVNHHRELNNQLVGESHDGPHDGSDGDLNHDLNQHVGELNDEKNHNEHASDLNFKNPNDISA